MMMKLECLFALFALTSTIAASTTPAKLTDNHSHSVGKTLRFRRSDAEGEAADLNEIEKMNLVEWFEDDKNRATILRNSILFKHAIALLDWKPKPEPEPESKTGDQIGGNAIFEHISTKQAEIREKQITIRYLAQQVLQTPAKHGFLFKNILHSGPETKLKLDWEKANPILPEGKLGIEQDTSCLKIGDGENNWKNLKCKSRWPKLENLDSFAPFLAFVMVLWGHEDTNYSSLRNLLGGQQEFTEVRQLKKTILDKDIFDKTKKTRMSKEDKSSIMRQKNLPGIREALEVCFNLSFDISAVKELHDKLHRSKEEQRKKILQLQEKKKSLTFDPSKVWIAGFKNCISLFTNVKQIVLPDSGDTVTTDEVEIPKFLDHNWKEKYIALTHYEASREELEYNH
eukprot:g2480.t1